jgi:predicted kinase
MREIILMVGIQGSGKSTWARKYVEEHENSIWISRDVIRKEIIGDGEYFSKEKEVWKAFCNIIEEAIENKKDHIVIDATHISIASRRKVLYEVVNIINVSNYNLKVMVMDTPLMTCLHRNEEREGFEYVPKSVIKRFSTQLEIPTEEEFDLFKNNFKSINIIHVREG